MISSNCKSPSTTIMSTYHKPSSVVHLKVDTNVPAVEGPRSSKARTPYCGVCFKAKQPASVYNSHWTRMNPNPRSPITCPLILQTVCNYCKNKGHSVNHCPVAEKKNERIHQRSSSISSNASSSQNCIPSSPNEKGSWLQAAIKSVPSDTKNYAGSHERRLSLDNPSTLKTEDNAYPSPPKLRKTRGNWNDDFDSDSDKE